MPRLTGFNSPFLLGFDHFERILERVSKGSAEGYPPYNIERIGDTGLRISVAVAGFSMDDLNVTVEDNQLTIRGRNSTDESAKAFLHRGIATRQFQRSFVLAEGIEIEGAFLDNGLLHIEMERRVPEPKVRNIKIVDASPSGKGKARRSKAIDTEPGG